MRRWIMVLCVGLLAVACSADDGTASNDTENVQDATMRAANRRARDTLNTFIDHINGPEPSSSYSIRARVGSGADSVVIWLDEPAYRNGAFRAVVGALPGEVSGVEIGQTVEVSRAEVLDWMFAEPGCMAGAYTLRVQRERLREEERDRFDMAMMVPFCE